MQKENALMAPEMAVLKAHQLRDLAFFLKPYFSFRAYINFGGPNKKRNHFYGHEHQCTYNQLLHGHCENIVLSKAKGFNDLVHFISNLKERYVSASIYMRTEQGGPFGVLCYEWYKGALTKHYEPVLSDDEVKILYFEIVKGQVIIREKPKEEIAIDFKAEIEAALKSKP